ncbi:MAG: LysM peptidoglycan-binding domain-containing protein [Ignavibacteria bacterium]|nr:LysM peptidoglycan-binding domain-containing protein [Ignavibacteria bacterium]
MSGCSGSEEEEVLTKRQTDSIMTYSVLQESFGYYKKALAQNESGDPRTAADFFEKALKKLNNTNLSVLNDPLCYNWKKDYEELARSIVQDYLITQSEIDNSSLVFDYASKLSISYEKIEHKSYESEPLPEGRDVPLVRNSVVDEYIEFFSNTDRGRSFVDKCLYRGGKYFPLMRAILRENDAPEELIYLSVQESGLSPTIVSRAGAVGLWQFMPATGKSYGLYQDDYRDDRRDFEKATDAAARHLKDLYRTFDDWYLAFAAYNAGPGRVRKAISRSGSNDFWVARSFLPGETKNYVPSIIALSFVLRDPAAYGFNEVELAEPIKFDRVEVLANMDLQRVAEMCGTDIETIRDLNPELTNDRVPMYDVPYHLRIPHNTFNTFSENYASANDIQKGSVEPQFLGHEEFGSTGIAGTEFRVNGYSVEDKSTIGATKDKVKVSHDLLTSQNLLWLSSYYDVRPVEIRLWNNINYGAELHSQKKVDIYLSPSRYERMFGLKNTGSVELADTKQDGSSSDLERNVDLNVTESPDASQEFQPEPPAEIEQYLSSSEPMEGSENSVEQTKEDQNTSVSENVTLEVEQVNTDQNDTRQEVGSDMESTQSSEELVRTDGNETSQEDLSDELSYSTHTVMEGENLSGIAKANNVSVSELMSWNQLESDKILVGQKLKIKVQPRYHTVSEGENLTMIAGKYGIDVNSLKDINGLSSDVIVPGQKLALTGEAKTEKKTSASSRKLHTVKKGDTLAKLANMYGVTEDELRKWNGIKGEKIMTGQVLKVSGDQGNTKVRKRK